MKLLNFYKLGLLESVLFAVAGNLLAADAPAGTNAPAITLEALVADVLEHNRELNFYRAEIAVAKGERRTAGTWANPQVATTLGEKNVRRGGLVDEGLAWSVAVQQTIEWPGRIGLRKAIANRDVELAELGFARFRLALAGRVRTLAYGLFAAQEKAEAAREVADRFQALREVLLQRDPAGLTPLLETRVIEATELVMQRKASEATLATQAALLELNQLRGVPPHARLSVASTHLAFRPAEAVQTLVALARTNNFELRLRVVELAQQGFHVELAKNERLPAISVGPTISEERAGDRERIMGVGVSLPLPLWNRNSGNIEKAKARQNQAEISLSVGEREIERKIAEAALIYQTTVGEMGKWRPDSVQHFKAAAELADRHYRLGAVPISTYVELQKQYLEAVESLLDTKKEALGAAQQLESLAGLALPLASTTEKEEPK